MVSGSKTLTFWVMTLNVLRRSPGGFLYKTEEEPAIMITPIINEAGPGMVFLTGPD